MFGGGTPAALADRFAKLVELHGGDMAAAKALGQQRALLAAVGQLQPATLNQVAARVKRGAPAISRAIDVLVRAGLVDRQPDPDNRRRLALTLTEEAVRRCKARPWRTPRWKAVSRALRTASFGRSSAGSKFSSGYRSSSAIAAAAPGFPALLGGGAAARRPAMS